MTEPATLAKGEPNECTCFLNIPKYPNTETFRAGACYDPAGVAGICFALMGLIVLFRVSCDLLARLFGWW